MASTIQTIKRIRDENPPRTKILLPNTLVLGHLNYLCMLLNGCTEENLEKLEKRIKWVIRSVKNINMRDFVTYVRDNS